MKAGSAVIPRLFLRQNDVLTVIVTSISKKVLEEPH